MLEADTTQRRIVRMISPQSIGKYTKGSGRGLISSIIS
jgi:hypothetical protein